MPVYARRCAMLAAVLLAWSTGVMPSALATTAEATPPSAEDVKEQETTVDRLTEVARGRAASVEAARERLDELAEQASAALEGYQLAQQALEDARARHWEASEQLAFATEESKRSRSALGRWAAQAYRAGGAVEGYDALVLALNGSGAGGLGHDMLVLNRVGRARAAVTADAARTEGLLKTATDAAERTSAMSMSAAAAAEDARIRSEQAVAQQREQVLGLQSLLDEAESQAAAAEDELARLAAARAVAEARAHADAGRSARITGTVGTCSGGELAGFANGQLPVSSLCPLWGAPGHLLRADAAEAFRQLSEAYAKEFGEPVCVTDSYRTLASQVDLRARKPGLAAVPGTSNHGWGKALDLCGGVQRFDSVQHAWMRQNAPLFNWFHPGWAQRTGSKPEPWHWEFAG